MVARPPATLRTHALAVAVHGLLALACLGPVLADPCHRAVGHPGNDVWNHVWGFWFVFSSLSEGTLPLHTELLAWPQGGSLWFIDSFNAVLTAPIQALFGPVAALNAAVGLNLALCGLGAHALALRVSGSRAGALFAGLCYQSAPHLLGQATNGITETLAAGWLPLALLGLLWAKEEPSLRRAAVAGLLFGLNAVANWYYGLFAGIVLLGLIVRELLASLGRPRPWALLRAWGLPLGLGAAVTGLVVAGPFGLFLRSMSAPDAIVTRDPEFVKRTLIEHNMTDVLALLVPGRFYSPDLKAAFDEDLIVVVYLGYSLLLPAGLALFGALRRKAEPWAALVCAFVLLCLGPYLYLGGAYRSVEGSLVALPFLWLFEAIPLFGRISHAYRFAVGATLGLSVMAALAIAAMGARPGARLAVGALCLARLVESMALSPAVMPLPWSEVVERPVLAGMRSGAVLDLPITLPVLSRARFIVDQVTHGRPVPFGLNDPLPTWLATNRYTRFLVVLERSRVALLPPQLPWLDLVAGRAEAVDLGLRYIVVHKDFYAPAEARKISAFLDQTARPVHDDAAMRIYVLDGAGGADSDSP